MVYLTSLDYSYTFVTFILLAILYAMVLHSSTVIKKDGKFRFVCNINVNSILKTTKLSLINIFVVSFVFYTYAINNFDYYHVLYANSLIWIYTLLVLMRKLNIYNKKTLPFTFLIIVSTAINYLYSTFLFEKNITSGSTLEFIFDAFHAIIHIALLFVLVLKAGEANTDKELEECLKL